jgi:8-oxo-dGTP pyrophosphatase MutT (NUDIX family)
MKRHHREETTVNKPIAPAVPAATIMLLRDGDAGLEVFMVVRHHQIDFASGALVFPGGKVDPQDSDERVLARLAGYDGATAGQMELRAAAIREAFEESGILLARRRGDGALPAATDLERWRNGLNDKSLKLGPLLEEGDLHLCCDDLVHYAHWITPDFMPKRFDTHFYLARVPHAQEAGHDGHENVDSVWISPKQVIADAEAGTRTVIFPTLSNVVKLAQYDSVEAAFEGTRRAPVVPIKPWTEKRGEDRFVCIPTDAGYTLTEHKASVQS